MKRYLSMSARKVTSLLLLLAVLTIPVAAQTGTPAPGSNGQNQPQIDPDSGEFDRFVAALEKVQEVQEEVNEQISAEISESGLTEERFNEIYRATQSPEISVEDEASEEEQETYEEVFNRVSEIQGESQSDMVDAVEENDLSVSRFNELIVAVRGNPELQETLQERMQ